MVMRRYLLSSLLLITLLLPALASADPAGGYTSTNFVPLANYQGSQLNTIYSSNSLPDFFNKLFAFSLSIGAILAVVMIVWGGYLYMFKDSFAAKLNAKEKITNAVIGLLLLLGIYLILYQINPDILKLNITFPKSSGNSAGQSTPQSGQNPFVDPNQNIDINSGGTQGLSPCPAGYHDGGQSVNYGCVPD